MFLSHHANLLASDSRAHEALGPLAVKPFQSQSDVFTVYLGQYNDLISPTASTVLNTISHISLFSPRAVSEQIPVLEPLRTS